MSEAPPEPPASRIPPPDDPRRYVYAEAILCNVCRSPKLRVYGKLPESDDGSVSRYTRCQACGARFIVITEMPDGYTG